MLSDLFREVWSIGPWEYESVVFVGYLAVIGGGFGAAIGLAQWLVLRRRVREAAWWVPANMIGLAIVEPALLGLFYLNVAGGGAASALFLLALLLTGPGMVTGTTLVWLMRRPLPGSVRVNVVQWSWEEYAHA